MRRVKLCSLTADLTAKTTKTVTNPSPIRVAIVGCGAVTEGFHLPVLAGHQDVSIAALVDPNPDRVAKLAALYSVPRTLPSAEALTLAEADAALIATPPNLHASVAIELMERGFHVLVEKPMALTTADGERMIDVAHRKGVTLSVGLFRRLVPAIRLFRSLLDTRHVGRLQRIEIEVGSAYTWGLTTLAGMNRAQAGGGILMDMGSHVLDLVTHLCDAVPTLEEYRDNAGSGIETDCRLTLGLRRDGVEVPITVELSRTRTLRNSIRAEGASGVIEWAFGERSRLKIEPAGAFSDPVTAMPRTPLIEARWRDDVEQYGYEGFRNQVDDWIDGIRTGRAPQLSGTSALPTVRLIEQCYAERQPLDEPWFTEGLRDAAAISRGSRNEQPSKRVLVTGASGFIGCRLSERLYFGNSWRVRALIRSPGRAVRLARMPLEFALGDLDSVHDLTRALEGCDAVVHGAIGTSWRRSERISTTVKGTKNLVEAALGAGVKRFVHLSSIAVYGDQATGIITEDTPTNPKKGWDYAESKYAAEQIVLEAASRGLPAIVLRIAVVFGPHNMTVVARPLEHLVQGKLQLVECQDAASNTIYVDNLCHGIELALDAPPEVNGQTFVLTDAEDLTWGQYYEWFASRIGAEVHHVEKRTVRSEARTPPGGLRRWFGSTRELVTSPELKALAKRVYASEPWGTPVRWFIDSFPEAAARMKDWVSPPEAFIYRPNPAPASALRPFRVDPITARVNSDKARRLLRFEPILSRERAMELTLAWARDARIVPGSVHDEVLVLR